MESTNKPQAIWATFAFTNLTKRASTGRQSFFGGWWRYSGCITRLCSMTCYPMFFERSKRDLGLDQPRVKSVPWPRRMHQASQFDQLMPKLTRLMVSISKTKMVGENVWTLPEYGSGNKIKENDLPEDLTLPPLRLYQVLINVFIQGLSKIAAPRTPRPRACPNKSSKSSPFIKEYGWEQWSCWWWCSIVL